MIRNISCISFDNTDALDQHAHTMLDKVQAHNDKIIKAEFILKKDAYKYVAELNVNVPHIKTVSISHSCDDMYHSITEVTNKMLIKLSKLKEKQKGSRHKQSKLDVDLDTAS